jgi:hypothetical protein
MEDYLIRKKRKTTSIFVRVEDDPKENNATKIQLKVKTIIFLEMEDKLNDFWEN